MESATKASTVNGPPQKATKHQGTRLETQVQGNGYDRAETIEDIISELNATARKDASLAEAFGDVTLNDDGQKSLDALDQWDPVSDSKTSVSSKTDGGELVSVPASTLDEAKSAAVLTDTSVSGEGESIVAFKANETDSQDASKVVEAANGDTDQPLEGKKASECSSTLETDAEKKSVNECNDEEPSGATPNVTVAGGCADEVITSDIKAPDEAVVSPRRTGRQRTASLKSASSSSPLAKAKGSAKVAKKPPEHTETEENDIQSVEPPSKKKLRRSLIKELTEGKGMKGNNDRRGLRSPEQNGTKRGKPMDSKKVQNLASKGKRKAVHEEELPLSDSTTPVGHSSDEGASVACTLSKPKKAKGKAGSSMEGASVSKKSRPLESKDSPAGLDAAVSRSGVTHADGNHFTMLNSLGHSAEAAQLWLPHHFISSDRNLQESVQLSVRRWEPPARPSYLAIEVPSVAAVRAWGPTPNRQRPTVVFGGCDPLNTYVNIHGVRVLLHQLQKVLRITPAIRLTDIFKCFKHV
ncbi:hypothetical protein HPB50_011567 [Hyalomma asiaticum]|uniref:Uncharacterized protein n=1 Tax=Hyalomma asiaticum TaxID=266040 RepID=A0ACB7SK33_HYAAI|nr:hypothetical protein HPB50_011567 [Hyalomma asiaticum]